MLRDQINTALKSAMKGRDERRTSTLRLVNAAIKNADIEAEMHGRPLLSDEDLVGLLRKLVKQRKNLSKSTTGRVVVSSQIKNELRST